MVIGGPVSARLQERLEFPHQDIRFAGPLIRLLDLLVLDLQFLSEVLDLFVEPADEVGQFGPVPRCCLGPWRHMMDRLSLSVRQGS